MDTIQVHVREQKDKQAELIVKFTKAIEQAGKIANAERKDIMHQPIEPRASPMQLNVGRIGDDLQSDDDNEVKLKSRTSMERERRATEQVLPSAVANSLTGSDYEPRFNATKTFTSKKTLFKRQPSIKALGENMTRKGKAELIEQKIIEFEGHVETTEELLREVHVVSQVLYLDH